MLARLLRHLLFPRWRVRRSFPPPTLAAIEQAIRRSETDHCGEIRFAIEAALEPMQVWRNQSCRERAIEVFSHLHVWDTARNNGVLIYVLLADRDVEIVADRGLNAHLATEAWRTICEIMESAFRAGDFAGGSLAGIESVGRLLAQYFPTTRDNSNELPDEPYVR
ncbi:MAG: TPM domain-containing protein [Chromatiales bacterium]